ncbi:acyl-CoA carboxylase epsilon subunit [Kitasatospora sp. NPDC002040]|uniref:acyl-CoA carboxylase epsilon subunit n=1 Tax=Kitasatospora sp. NPDC002040 TaxID=3154661 RepID=UPI0033334DFD
MTGREEALGLRVARGRPTDEELAAVVVALAVVARARAATAAAGPGPGGRLDRGERLRRTPGPRGASAWRHSGWRCRSCPLATASPSAR